MQKSYILAVVTALFITIPALADPVHGEWKSATNKSGAFIHVKINDCGTNLCGTITKVVGSKRKGADTIVGKSIIKNMKANGNGTYSGGTIWDPEKNKTYASKMSLNGNNLKVSGCVAGGLFCRGQTWKRL